MQLSRRAGIVAAATLAVVAVVMLATLMSAFSPSARATPSPSPSPSPTAVATPSPSPAATASPSPTPTPTATPLATPSPTPALLTCPGFDGTAEPVIRLERIFELGLGWVVHVYADGRVITPGIQPYQGTEGAWRVVRQLSPSGVEALLNEVTATGLFGESASYPPVPLPGVDPPGRGGAGYAITLGSGSSAIRVTWTSLFGDDELYYEPSPERELLDALGERVVDFGAWLPASAWTNADACAYQADRFRVFVEAQAWGGPVENLPVDVTEISWPLGGNLLDWGRDVGGARQPPPYLLRCEVVSRDDADLVRRALRSAGARVVRDAGLDGGPTLELELGEAAGPRIVSVILRPMLPEERGCTARDLPNPFAI
jgi:hypothetical protein